MPTLCKHNNTYDTFHEAEEAARKGSMFGKVITGKCPECNKFVNTLRPQFMVPRRPAGGWNK